MSARARIVMLALLVAMVGRPASQAHGENFFKRKAKGAVRAVSEVFAPGVSTLVDAASTPVFRNAEGTGRRLLYDFEGVAARRLDQAGTLVNKAVDNAFDETGKLVVKVDASLEARILQVTTGANSIVDNVGEEARSIIKTADQMIANNIARVGKVAMNLLDRVDDLAEQRLAQIDEMFRLRLGDVSQMIQTTLAQADEIAKARLDQLDEIAGRRIGNIDVIATKQGLSLEAMLVRLSTLMGAFAFFAFLMWSAWTNFVKSSDLIDQLREGGTTPAVKRTIWRKIGLWTLQTGFATICLVAVVIVAGYLPKDAQKRSAAHVAEHAQALTNAVDAYDFTSVRYHHSQLEILRPGDPTFRGLAIKAELMRDMFERPARMHTAEGLRDIERQLDAARALVPYDPDLLAIEGYVIWHVGSTRDDELDAADLCAQALALRPRGNWTVRFLPGRFLLRPLAENYVRRFRHDPFEPRPEQREALARVTEAQIPPASHLQELEQVFAYNELVATLDEDLMPAYLEMLDAHVVYAEAVTAATYVPATAQAARKVRAEAAKKVAAVWLAFDGALDESDALAGDPATLNAFTLDDTMMSQALYFYAEAFDDKGNELAMPAKAPAVRLPRFFDGCSPPGTDPRTGKKSTKKTADACKDYKEQLRLRLASAPLRIRWAQRVEPLLGKTTRDVLAKEEADRYRMLEQRRNDFTTAYVEVRKAADGKIAVTSAEAKKTLAANAEKAARAAAEMGLWRLDDPKTPIGHRIRKPFAPDILEAAAKVGGVVEDKTGALKSALANAQQKRRLRFL